MGSRSSARVVRGLLRAFVKDDWLHRLDLTTLEKVRSDFVTYDLKQRASDVIWRAKADGEWMYVYFMLEIQRTVDPWMAALYYSFAQVAAWRYQQTPPLPGQNLRRAPAESCLFSLAPRFFAQQD